MLDACIRLAPPRGWALHVVHVDHGLRANSSEDAVYIEQMCAQNKVPFTRSAVVVEPGSGIQAKAREARYRILREVCEHLDADVIATAHTADDQAETVLMRAFAQATPKALSGIEARRGDLSRPLLGSGASRLESTARLSALSTSTILPTKIPSSPGAGSGTRSCPLSNRFSPPPSGDWSSSPSISAARRGAECRKGFEAVRNQSSRLPLCAPHAGQSRSFSSRSS